MTGLAFWMYWSGAVCIAFMMQKLAKCRPSAIDLLFLSVWPISMPLFVLLEVYLERIAYAKETDK